MNTELQSTIQAKSTTPLRHHSAKLVSATQSWIAGIDWATTNELSTVRTEWTDKVSCIAAEAAFLGFARVVRLCRALHATLIKKSAMGDKISVSQKAALMRAVLSLGRLLVNPRIETAASMQALVQDLQSEFQLTENELSTELSGEISSSLTELTNLASEALSDIEHRDLDVYRSSRLDSLDQCFEEETWIVSQLASLAEDLANGTHSHHPAGRLMHVLRGHKFFNQVDRVCLAGRVANANQLVVVDASLSDRCPANSLKKGYSCFVNPEGSLFKMKPGTVRVFSDCERVLASFAVQGKPAQRSIALISDQGLRSGFCLAIGRGDEIQGFLFLNSIQENLFGEITASSAPLLSLFGLVATIGLDISGFHLSSESASMFSECLPNTSTIFEAAHFQSLVSQSLDELQRGSKPIEVSMVTSERFAPFLYLPTTVIGTLAELVFRTGRLGSERKLELNGSIASGEVHIAFDHNHPSTDLEWLNRIVQIVRANLGKKPIKILLTEKHLSVVFSFEPFLAGHRELLYSTVY